MESMIHHYLIVLPRQTYSRWCCRHRNDPGCCDGEHTHRFTEALSPEPPPPPPWACPVTAVGACRATVATWKTSHPLCTTKPSWLTKGTPGWHIASSLSSSNSSSSLLNNMYIIYVTLFLKLRVQKDKNLRVV